MYFKPLLYLTDPSNRANYSHFPPHRRRNSPARQILILALWPFTLRPCRMTQNAPEPKAFQFEKMLKMSGICTTNEKQGGRACSHR